MAERVILPPEASLARQAGHGPARDARCCPARRRRHGGTWPGWHGAAGRYRRQELRNARQGKPTVPGCKLLIFRPARDHGCYRMGNSVIASANDLSPKATQPLRRRRKVRTGRQRPPERIINVRLCTRQELSGVDLALENRGTRNFMRFHQLLADISHTFSLSLRREKLCGKE
jgi:hypothetical protein